MCAISARGISFVPLSSPPVFTGNESITFSLSKPESSAIKSLTPSIGLIILTVTSFPQLASKCDCLKSSLSIPAEPTSRKYPCLIGSFSSSRSLNGRLKASQSSIVTPESLSIKTLRYHEAPSFSRPEISGL